MIELFINNKKADLDFETEISLSKSLITKEQEEFSYSFTLPPTKTNREILNFLGSINVANKYMYKYTAKLYKNSSLLFQGFLYIDSASMDGFDCNLVSSQGVELDDLFGDSLLRDIKLDKDEYYEVYQSPYDCIVKGINNGDYSKAYKNNRDLKIGEDPTKATNWIYPYALYGQPYNIRNINNYDVDKNYQSNVLYPLYIPRNLDAFGKEFERPEDALLLLPYSDQMLLPMFNVKGTIKSAIESIGYKATGNFFEDQNAFSYLYESFRGTYKEFLERDNQRFSCQVKIGPVYTTSLTGEVVKYNPLLNRPGSEEPSIWYKSLDLLDVAFTRTNEFGTPRDVSGQGSMIKDDPETGNKYIKVLKSGWYNIKANVNIESDINTIISRQDSDKIALDFGGCKRNMWELQVVYKGTDDTLYSNILGINNTVANNYINLDKYNFENRVQKVNLPGMSPDTHFVANGNNDAYGFFLQEIPSTTYWTTNAMFMPLQKRNDATDPLKGDGTLLDSLSFVENGGVLEVDNENFICGFRFGNYHYSPSDKFSYNSEDKNRNPYVLLMNLPDLTNKPYGHSGNGLLDNVYKLDNLDNNIGLAKYKYMDMPERFETGTYGGMTALSMVSKNKSYSASRYFTANNMTPDRVLTLEELHDGERYQFVKKSINKDYFDSPIHNQVSCIPARLNPAVTAAEKNNRVAVEDVDYMEAKDCNFIVWLEAGKEITVKVAQPMIMKERTYEEESYTPVEAYVSLDLQLEYIGTHDKEWKPGVGDGADAIRRTYMHQYFDDVKTSDYIQGIADLFNLKIEVSKIDNTFKIDYFSGVNNVVDITDKVDFDSIKFEDNEKPKSYILSLSPSLKQAQTALSPSLKQAQTALKDNSDYIDGSNGTYVLSTGGSGESNKTNIDYAYPSTKKMKIQYGLSGNTYMTSDVPCFCTKEIEDKVLPNLNKYNYSGNEKPSLFFLGNNMLSGWNTKWQESYDVNKTYENNKRTYPLMATKRDGIDLKDPVTIMRKFYNIDNENNNMECEAYLPYNMYERMSESTLVKINDSLYKVVKIDNYTVCGGDSGAYAVGDGDGGRCTLTLTPFM